MTSPLVEKRLKYLADLNREMLPEDTNPDQGFRYIDIGAVGRGCLISEPTAMTFDEAPSRARRIVADGIQALDRLAGGVQRHHY